MRSLACFINAALFAALSYVTAQPVFTDVFPPDEYAARRARVMSKIGDAVAILQGTTEPAGEQPLRQSNQFFYLCGVVEARAILLIDGRTRRTTLFLLPRTERQEKSMFGPGLSPGEAAEKQTGVDAALPREQFQAALAAIAREGRVIFTPFRPEVLGSQSAEGPAAWARATKSD